MAITIFDWYNAVKDEGVLLIAGKDGINKNAERVHVVEKPEFAEFIDGGEIIFITGVAEGGSEELTEIIKACARCGAVGFVLNIGRYINKVPEELISYCNNHDFPLFTVPWSVHLEGLMHKFFLVNQSHGVQEREIEMLLQNAIQFPERYDLYINGLKNHGFQTEWPYCISLVTLPDALHGSAMISTNKAEIIGQFRQELNKYSDNSFVFENGGFYVFLFASNSSDMVNDGMKNILQNVGKKLGITDPIPYSIGKTTRSIRCLHKSYKLGEKILRLRLNGQLPKEITAYKNLGIYKIVIGLENQDILNEIHNEYLQPLIESDNLMGTDYVDFIDVFLRNDGKIREIADEMFVHRNTVHYRINKIEELLDCSIDRTDIRMYLLIALSNYKIKARE